MRDIERSHSFQRWRRITRWCMAAGPLLLLLVWRVDDPIARRIMFPIGVVLVLAVFPMYSRWCNRCPRCHESFSKAPEYASDETSGLPLFHKIARCPFCSLDLDSARRYL